MTSLKEAAVTNCNLAQIVKLISENSTTQEEKKEINILPEIFRKKTLRSKRQSEKSENLNMKL